VKEADLKPQDSILWIHILLMMLSFGIIFPFGMVLGVGSSRAEGIGKANLAMDRLRGIDFTYQYKW